MLGDPRKDKRQGLLDPLGKYGAAVLYAPQVAIAARLTPQEKGLGWRTLHASNKPSEHNVRNVLPRVVVYQSPRMKQSPDLRKRISYRPTLRPGNQSLGGT